MVNKSSLATHIIDPDSEVMILLRNSSIAFAQSDEDMVVGLSPAEESGRSKKRKGSRAIQTSLEPTPPPIEESATEPTEEQPIKEPTKSGLVCEPLNESCFGIQVSVEPLILASSVFKKILPGGWKESLTYLQKGLVEIACESWNIEALLILLQCKLCIFFFTDTWINALEEKAPTIYSRDVMLSAGLITNWELPISDKVIGSMNELRQEAINDVILFLYRTRESLLRGNRGCGFECNSFLGSNYQCLVQILSSFKSAQWYTSSSSYEYHHDCSDASPHPYLEV
ncbi:uncharacterized protein BDW43DRAFT_320640 [Aspergillus alliaceus]|uniref:uncharacterized protein n=1 Tax=Petromyces alliaceus TaxID=209559 RepID=UPI0012A602F0|nr:uncharacterized protein BDW43DRAFT_320640 [Aspergillus alliaceus]KAB8231576.1 hypothetical protein BDW43DRAFT_320640 [Aspergillus alliaceus]